MYENHYCIQPKLPMLIIFAWAPWLPYRLTISTSFWSFISESFFGSMARPRFIRSWHSTSDIDTLFATVRVVCGSLRLNVGLLLFFKFFHVSWLLSPLDESCRSPWNNSVAKTMYDFTMSGRSWMANRNWSNALSRLAIEARFDVFLDSSTFFNFSRASSYISSDVAYGAKNVR